LRALEIPRRLEHQHLPEPRVIVVLDDHVVRARRRSLVEHLAVEHLALGRPRAVDDFAGLQVGELAAEDVHLQVVAQAPLLELDLPAHQVLVRGRS